MEAMLPHAVPPSVEGQDLGGGGGGRGSGTEDKGEMKVIKRTGEKCLTPNPDAV